MPRRLILVVAMIVTSAACTAEVDGDPPDRVILPGWNVLKVLDQCSRSAPSRGERAWQPTWADIDALEAALPAALGDTPRGRELLAEDPLGSEVRQYVGIVRKGRRFVYGNFLPRDAHGESWRTEPILVCDGGPRYFGVEYDVEARRITHLEFNGVI